LSRAPAYLVHFTQREASEAAQALMSLEVCTKEEKARLATELERVKFNSPYGKDVKRWLRHGIGVHHAGLLPKYRILVEQLAQQGLLKLICGTDTLGVGINVPIRTVVFTQLWKYDGKKAAVLACGISGRSPAGRAARASTTAGLRDRPGAGACHREQARRGKGGGQSAETAETREGRAPEGAVGWDAGL
jgi:superfamily II RNA helicase